VLVGVALFLHDPPIHGCTAFCAANKDQVLVGNNEDWYNARTKIWFVPAQDGSFGRMYVGFDDLTPQGGMNERGLWFDGFAALPIKVTASGRPRYSGNLVDKAMAECATVEEVIRLFERYDRTFLSEAILMFADATGDAVSIEAEAIVRKRGPHFVQTNFRQSRSAEDGGLTRFKTASAMLEASGNEVSADLFRRILSRTHQGGGSPTQYSNIYELRSRTMLLYYFHDFEHVLKFDLVEELKKGARVLDIPGLFPRNSDAEAFAARQGERRPNENTGLPDGIFVAGMVALPLILLTLGVYALVKGARGVRIAVLVSAGAIALAAAGAIAVLEFHGQASGQWVRFSIGPSSGNSAWIGPTIVRADGLTLRQALATAYDVPAVRVIGPPWISQVRYSIDASVAPERADSFRALLRQELERRAGVKTHTTVRPFDVFVLSASATPRLERGIGDGVKVWMHEADVQMQDVSMKDLASALQSILGTPVIDETGIEGSYNMDFAWTRDRVESVTSTLDRKFGLRLARDKRDLSVLIVDDIRRDAAMLLLDHVGRLTARAPASFRRQVARILTVH
jgi:uncharacterized protein (TIGR03435 family)